MTPAGVITIGIPPGLHLGPLTLMWHGLTIVLGIVLGGLLARRWVSERGLDPEPITNFMLLAGLGGIVGARLWYVMEHGGPLLGTRGFTFDGGLLLAAVIIAIYLRRTLLPVVYLDVAAAALPLGVAFGRIGDLINGEHYGPRSDFFLAVRNSNPDASTPNSAFAYQNGGLYEMLLATLIFLVVWPLRHRVRRPGAMVWLVLGLFAAGRFVEFFVRSDSPALALGLNNTQWASLGLLVLCIAGWALTSRRAAPVDPIRSSGRSLGSGGSADPGGREVPHPEHPAR